MALIDLHAHSNVSDGTEPPAAVVDRARAAGLDVLALTDHDTVAGWESATSHLPPGLTLVPGMELSCASRDASVHLLAYLFDPDHPELAAELRHIRADRVIRAETMVRRLRAEGVDVAWRRVQDIAAADGQQVRPPEEEENAVGRPHVARAIVEAGAASDVQDAFDRWIGAGCAAYVERYALDPVRAATLVRAAGGVCSLAHPARAENSDTGAVPEPLVERMAHAGLGGIEADHPSHDDAETAHWRGVARRLGLAITGSSDDHGELTGHRLGSRVTAPAEFTQLTGPATGTRPVTGG